MEQSGTLYGGAPLILKLKVGATITYAGIITIGDGTNDYGEAIPCTTTSFADTCGISLDTATYTTTQSSTMTEGVVTVDARPDCIIRARMSGGATTGTDLTTLANTSASSGGTVVTDADVGTADWTGGYIWCISGANVGLSRVMTTFSSATSATVTVPFPRAIAVGDEFLFCPWSRNAAGGGNVQVTSDFREANAAIAAGTGGVAAVVKCELNEESDSYVHFVLQDHILADHTL